MFTYTAFPKLLYNDPKKWYPLNNRSARLNHHGWEWAGSLFSFGGHATMNMPKKLKPGTSIEKQISLLRSRGMQISDSEAQQWLQFVSYYRLSGYWFPRYEDGDQHDSKKIHSSQTLHSQILSPSTKQTESYVRSYMML